MYRITQPGSYYLTGNLSCDVGKSCIEIAASNVTLDLMGFRILGVPGANYGIVATGSQSNVTVRNGSVRTFSADGVQLGFADNSRLFLPATLFNRFAVTREINDGLLAPRFAPSQRAWVLQGSITPLKSPVPASSDRDFDDR